MKKFIFIFILFFSIHSFGSPIHYKINVHLNVKEKTLKGYETITFKNIYREGLNDMYIHLYPNAFRPESRMDKEKQKHGDYSIALASKEDQGFLNIETIKSTNNIIKTVNEGDELHLFFSKPMKLNDTISLNIKFFEKIPKFFMREGYEKNHFELTQWYPKVAMYDKKGWHHEGYNDIGEFYGEFADYDVMITLPVNFITGATGALLGPDGEIERMKKLSKDPLIKNDFKMEKSVYYKATNVTDFAFVADPNFVMDNFKYKNIDIKILKKRKNLKNWDSAAIYVKRAIDFYSDNVGPYPFKHLTVIDGNITAGGGMEYPELIIIGTSKQIKNGFSIGNKYNSVSERVIAHETGHQWFYGALATDEYNEPFMDESINSFFENEFMKKYGKKKRKNPEFASVYNNLMIAAVPYYANIYYPMNVSCSRFNNDNADNIQYGAAIYSEGAIIMREIRSIMGQKEFNNFIHEYYKRYKFSHPHIDDFIRLSYQFTDKKNADYIKSLFDTPVKQDISFAGIKRTSDSITVSLHKNDYYPAVPVTFIYDDTTITVYSPAGTGDITVSVRRRKGLKNIIVNRDEDIFEVNRFNNYWKNRPDFNLLASLPSFDHYQLFLGPYAWYDSRNGIITGIWLEGREFINYDFLQGRNQWHLGFNWQFGNMHPEYIFAYSTPIVRSKNYLKFIYNIDLYDYIYTSQIALEKKFAGNFNINLLAKQYLIGKAILTYKDVSKVDSNYIDPLDYQAGKMSTLQLILKGKNKYKYMDVQFENNVQLGKKGLLSDFDILRGWTTVNMQFGGLRKFIGLDIFAGAGNADLPINYRYDMAVDMLSAGFDGKHVKAYSGVSGKFSLLLPFIDPYIATGYMITPSSKSGLYYTAGIKLDFKALTVDIPLFYKSPEMTGVAHRIVFIFDAAGIRIGSISL